MGGGISKVRTEVRPEQERSLETAASVIRVHRTADLPETMVMLRKAMDFVHALTLRRPEIGVEFRHHAAVSASTVWTNPLLGNSTPTTTSTSLEITFAQEALERVRQTLDKNGTQIQRLQAEVESLTSDRNHYMEVVGEAEADLEPIKAELEKAQAALQPLLKKR